MYKLVVDGKEVTFKSVLALENKLVRMSQKVKNELSTTLTSKVQGKWRVTTIVFTKDESLVRVHAMRGIYNERGFYWTLRFVDVANKSWLTL